MRTRNITIAAFAAAAYVTTLASAASPVTAEPVRAAKAEAPAAAKVRPEDRIIQRVDRKPRELEGVELEERTGEYVPLDLAFTDERGQAVTLGEILGDDNVPVILTLNYSGCPMLCSLQLGALTRTLVELPHSGDESPLRLGQHFRIVTISLDPNEKPEKARATKAGYIARLEPDQQAGAQAGWHFLTGSAENIKAVTDAVGFGVRYLSDKDEYLHPAAIMVLAYDGMIIRYIKGVEYPAKDLSDSVMAAANKDPQASIGFFYACFHYDSDANSYAGFSRRLMTYVGSAFAFLLLAVVAWQITRSRRNGAGGHDDSDVGVQA